jgi:hypothetical protein
MPGTFEDVVNKGRLGGGFAHTGWTGNEDEAVRAVKECLNPGNEVRGDKEFLEGEDAAGDEPECESEVAFLFVNRHPESSHIFEVECEVAATTIINLCPEVAQVFGGDVFETFGFVRCKYRAVFDGVE